MNERDRRRLDLPVDNEVIVKEVPEEKIELYPQYAGSVVAYLPDGSTILTAKPRYKNKLI